MLFHKTYTHQTSTEWVVLVHGAGSNSSIWFKQLKEFVKHFNVLTVDLRGHGKSKDFPDRATRKNYTFDVVSQDVLEVINHLKITSAHFIGISLGTLIIRTIAELDISKVKTMILGGAITHLNWFGRLMVVVSKIYQHIVPFYWLYLLCAYILMPGKRHKEARTHFVQEAKKLEQAEFLRWFALTLGVVPTLKHYFKNEVAIPTLYIMGEDDFMFLPHIAEQITKKHQYAHLKVIHNTGHVCNVEAPEIFNSEVIKFVQAETNK
jgi:pimeloyl-ACP methyl ester carboxylesterase